MEESKAVSLSYTFESLCRFFSNKDASGLLGLPEHLPQVSFNPLCVFFLLFLIIFFVAFLILNYILLPFISYYIYRESLYSTSTIFSGNCNPYLNRIKIMHWSKDPVYFVKIYKFCSVLPLSHGG